MADNNDEFKKHFEEGLKHLKDGDNLYNLKKYDDAKVAYIKAIEWFEKAVQINPENEEALLSLGTTYLNLGNIFLIQKILKLLKRITLKL